MKKQTAVEYLVKYITSDGCFDLHKVIEQAKQMEKEQKFSMDFIVWYSGMKPHQIENAHKRWINETFKSE